MLPYKLNSSKSYHSWCLLENKKDKCGKDN